MGKFGQTAEEYAAKREAQGEEFWMKKFREGSTRIRVLPLPTNRWYTYREHYADGVGHFPCTEDQNCVGCSSSSTKTRDRTRIYAFHALDDQGRVQIFKIGVKLYEAFQRREQRLNTLSDRDYVVTRTGKTMNNTTYDLDPSDKYEIEFPDELPDPEEINTANYQRAMEMLANDGEPPAPEEPEASERPAAATGGRIQPQGTKKNDDDGDTESRAVTGNRIKPPAKDKPAANNEPAPEPAAGEEPDEVAFDPTATKFDVDETETDDIRSWLEAHKIEFPAKAPRARLVKMAKENMPGF